MDLFEGLKEKISGKDIKVVFPEGIDARIIGAAVRLAADGLCHPIILGNKEVILSSAQDLGFLMDKVEIIDPETYPEDKKEAMVDALVERRKGKLAKEDAYEWIKNVNYFGTMLTYMGDADAMVSGAIHSTGDTVRPALQIIKTKPGVSRTSGAFIIFKRHESYLFSDCAININPNSQELAEIAVESAKTAELFDIDPIVSLLSFSTKGSAKSDEVDKVVEATRIAQELAPEYQIDGELQFDASFVPTVAQLKAPESNVAGNARVFIFPDLQSGNIGYKIAQRLGGYEAIGPILQGLNKPVSDLSRGCVEEDVYKLAIITAAQTLIK
ncbi:phosphate acetyltransferase [Erysipelothrix rhusiopathiae]|uniref:Phosphate acetyltransferase n=3 Tax=Erysipelothrix TaxID=1647 RepID=E7FXZ7_ERYRH|nr:phosphate acetyltransferase [Erysipelothrix rhusiopathiae]CAH2761068.1 phosphate acetyltransferase [Erysipelothrix sp. A18Y020d]AGN25203.1 phosphate acetyltransferase [Erysipelothrix rhusiopathiae SY1027]AMS11780.1 phosphate acetyltransferase [Erysipelothrix rhusiopathiae]AOO68280.1 phosphate acetyltransferase [Erysipelothrix rhusiopathiae]AWU40871.1 phosphate acetyltransferase [Erysipelothrix rhusiopathiae]